MRIFGWDRRDADKVILPQNLRMIDRQFVFYFAFTSWFHLSLGFHIDFESPNIEIHVPFGFLRFGFAGLTIPGEMSDREVEELMKEIHADL